MTKHPSPCAVVKVGNGRGFIIEQRNKLPRLKLPPGRHGPVFARHRLVVTAAHCLRQMPPVQPTFYYERTYKGLLGALDGTLDGSKNSVWAECLFADMIGDVAVLGCPDEEELSEEADAYHALADEAATLLIGNARSGRGWLLALSGDRWVQTTLKVFSGWGGTSLKSGPTEPGMSGSPILNDAGRAVSIVSQGAGLQPILTRNLPGWLL